MRVTAGAPGNPGFGGVVFGGVRGGGEAVPWSAVRRRGGRVSEGPDLFNEFIFSAQRDPVTAGVALPHRRPAPVSYFSLPKTSTFRRCAEANAGGATSWATPLAACTAC